MKWIDAHVHIGNDTSGVSATLDEVTQLFDDDYLDQAVVFCFNEQDGIAHGNHRIADVVADDDRLVGLFRVDPEIHRPEDLEAAAENGFAGFKMHPRSQDFGMQQVYEHLETVGDLGKPVLIHTGVGDDQGTRRAHPEEIAEAAAIHTDTDIILAHNTKGYYFHAPDSFVNTLKRLDNIYIDISLHCTPLGVETMVNELGAEKLLFASDYPYGHPVPMQKNIEFANISDDEAEMIASRNADQLFFQ